MVWLGMCEIAGRAHNDGNRHIRSSVQVALKPAMAFGRILHAQ